MDKATLLTELEILRQGRDYCVSQLTDNVDIRMSYFKYRKSSAIMALIIDKYNTDCLNQYIELGKDQPLEIRQGIARAVASLIDNGISLNNSDLCHHLLIDKKRVIDCLISGGDGMERRYKELLVAKERDKARYEDKIERIEKMMKI